MKAANEKEILKHLSRDELLIYVFQQRLPDDFEHRLNASRMKSPEVREAQRHLKAVKLGLEAWQLSNTGPWKRVALVLPVHRGRCLSCGTTFEAPFGKPLVKEVHATLGTHMKRPEEGVDTSDLPHEYCYHDEQLTSCHHCFKQNRYANQLSLSI